MLKIPLYTFIIPAEQIIFRTNFLLDAIVNAVHRVLDGAGGLLVR